MILLLYHILLCRKKKKLKETDINKLKAHLSKTMMDDVASTISDASAHKISLDCEELSSQYSRRSSDGTIPATQLEELTLATYSMFTASALVPGGHSDNESQIDGRSPQHKGDKSSSRCSGSKLQTPKSGYVNGALDDGDISDVSI